MGYQGRDVQVTTAQGFCLVATCDSSGAIGEKEMDRVRIPAYITGRFTTRVALLEVLATGAEPRIVTAAICNEPDPTGEEILRGIRAELRQVSEETLPLAISCEKNMITRETGLGITVVGLIEAGKLQIGMTKPGDAVYLLGLPKVGSEVSCPEDPEIVQTPLIRALRGTPAVHDIVPVGSKGILGEIRTLTEGLGLEFCDVNPVEKREERAEDAFSGEKPDLEKSGGPATCAVVTVEKTAASDVLLQVRRQLCCSVPIVRLGSVS
ncbi:Hypothetical protein DEACI_2049 [Acididesulfobacillus acetoxydans]|uniref:Alpha-ribazole kinase n=1 Tax=Acididesulfobacillus acetoxydans TaxID=1561005 RepID=A0A8S0VWY8_9FIRM|nr:alpha-ribazole kinase [Acididesulfobacillus acetoxydans]CAA7601383.1 Hypothetical protein DEACI_2049 [Acididesulfobacillus acetoxydans]CEJ07456.1 Alpha-ribazole kinase [Acididesulfobacillus acetoxydans]